jgi:hypothetical protein
MKNATVIMLVVCLVMAAPALAAPVWTGTAGDGLWNTAGNWDTGVPTGGDTYITNGDSVTLSGTAGDTRKIFLNNSSSLIISTDLDMSNDLLIDSGGTVTLNSGTISINGDKVKMADDDGPASFFMNGGAITTGDKFEIYSGALLEISGGSLSANDGDGFEFGGGTIRVVGDGASLIYCTQVIDGGGTYEFVPTAAGGITTITSSSDAGKLIRGAGISVDLDDLAVPTATMTLFQGAPLDTMSVTVTKDGSTLVEGVDYTLDYLGGTGLELSVVPEPATMTLLALGGLAMLRRRRNR